MEKKSFRRFLDEWHRGSINAEGVSLGAADTYELYSYMWDVLNSRRGGFWRKRMAPQTHMEMAADWADANPQFGYRKNHLFHPETIRKLGFVVDEGGYVHLTDGVARTNTTRPAAAPRAVPKPIGREAILQIIKSGDLNSFLRFVADDSSALNAKQPPYNETILHDLAGLGNETLPVHARMADELIRAGADVNCRNALGWTPIHLIAIHGRKEACELARILIAHGADINATANDGISDWRVLWKHGHEIRELLSAASLRRRRT